MYTLGSFSGDDGGHHVDKEGEDDREKNDEKKHESSSVTKVKVISKLTSLGLDDFKTKMMKMKKIKSGYAVKKLRCCIPY